MTSFDEFRLGQFRLKQLRLRQIGKVGVGIIALGAIASLSACITVQAPPVATSPTPSPSSTKAASPSPSVAAVPPVETPVTVAVESAPKVAAPAPSPATSAAPPAATQNPAASSSNGLCKANEGAIISVETKNYRIAICGRGEPEFYVGVEKDDPTKSIRLPLTTFASGFYEAANGNTIYILAKTPRGHFLTVTQGEKELLREVVSGWGN